jgi:large subunit ribosomal protein L9
MKIYMLKDVEKVGMAGQILNVSDGYANNYLLPKKFALKIHSENENFFAKKLKKQKVGTQILNSKTSMLAERIKSLHLIIKERVHDDGKLYGSVSADEIVVLMKEKGFGISKKQVIFGKSIKAVGEYKVSIKLSSKLIPQITLAVVEK